MAEKSDPSPTYKVLVLGGCGFIGRNVVEYLTTRKEVKHIRVADKVMPSMAWMNIRHRECFKKVDFKHSNLINPKSVANVFHLPDGSSFNYVINCAGETKFDQSNEVYEEGIVRLSENCATQAATCQVLKYVEISTAHLHSDKNSGSEASGGEPLTVVARYKQTVEERLQQIAGLNYVILRPAVVYGSGDRQGLTPRLIIGAVYRYMNETLQLLWSKDLKVNTVHVYDVAKAAWHVCLNQSQHMVYNLADPNNTNQGMIADLVADIFQIKYEFIGTLASQLAKLQLSDVVADINEKHVIPWGTLCQEENIINTPLTPFICEELLQNKDLIVDGSLIEETGFVYDYPKVKKDLLVQVLEEYCELKIFPKSVLQK